MLITAEQMNAKLDQYKHSLKKEAELGLDSIFHGRYDIYQYMDNRRTFAEEELDQYRFLFRDATGADMSVC